jgi:iron complex transport system ATP-binding protein
MDLSLEAGRFVALLGPNGSGKSTLLRTLVGMQWPLEGSIALGGRALATMDVAARARHVSAVLTERFDPGWFTVFDIVSFGRYPHTDFRNELGDEDRRVVAASLEAVGLGDFAQRLFAELSDGERQKAMIARALAQEAPFIVLDEPTAFLDAPARIEIFHLARRLAREGRAVLLSTHEVDLALREADALWLVDRKGGFVAGSPEDLALSGAIGAAFDGPRLAFDTATGIFRSPEERLPFALGVSGEDSAGLAWTIRLAERLGLSLEPERGRYDALVRVKVAGGGHAWTLEVEGARSDYRSVASLESALRDLVARQA